MSSSQNTNQLEAGMSSSETSPTLLRLVDMARRSERGLKSKVRSSNLKRSKSESMVKEMKEPTEGETEVQASLLLKVVKSSATCQPSQDLPSKERVL